ncbi:hypothetical protein [Paractinoplanes hotanensis]|uniref:Replicase polyprotein 1ab n=1 Tax=Paractinoplanes hotanensis TaxID=2906497 RepID=A0ABT0YFD9_9ACTN|nr:hypothetical protein [Actinoplanes hotanensis]MCM4083974.1 hypothetical protein [Actinoplanes hotanensis]
MAFVAPEIPEDIEAADLDKEVRSELLSLAREIADKVARHLVAAGQIIDEDAELALQHAIAARRLASRIAVVREAVGLAAYAAGDWTTAIAELRTYHRMTGQQTHLAELADCERALGRPERAIDLYRGADLEKMDKSGAIELLIVAAGARTDLGQNDAAVSMLQVRELNTDEDAEWAARLRYAYADALLAAGRREEAREWFTRAATADDEGLTDAAERLLELDGVTLADEDTEPDDGDRRSGTTPAEEEAELDGDDERATVDDDDEDDEYDDEDEDDEYDDEDEDDEPAARGDIEDGDDEDDEPAARGDIEDDEDEDDEPAARGDDEDGDDEDDEPAARNDVEDGDDEVAAVADTDVNTDPVAVEDVAEELEADAEELADEKRAEAGRDEKDEKDEKAADEFVSERKPSQE